MWILIHLSVTELWTVRAGGVLEGTGPTLSFHMVRGLLIANLFPVEVSGLILSSLEAESWCPSYVNPVWALYLPIKGYLDSSIFSPRTLAYHLLFALPKVWSINVPYSKWSRLCGRIVVATQQGNPKQVQQSWNSWRKLVIFILG